MSIIIILVGIVLGGIIYFAILEASSKFLNIGCLWMWLPIIIGLIIGGVIMFTVNFPTKKNNEHVGFITAVEEDSVLGSTMAKVYVKTDLSSSQEDTYCINGSDADLKQKARDYASEKKNVIIKYDSYFNENPWRCSGDTITGLNLKQ